MDRTLNYYQENTDRFVSGTVGVDFSSVTDRFLQYLRPGAEILDFGCGSGRDTRYFLERGYRVDAVDGSPKLCSCAEKLTGIPVRCMLFQELDEDSRYDGIWACASILHVSKEELPDIFRRMLRALKPEGILYTSFKYGEFEGIRGGRYFTDFTEASFREFLSLFPELQKEEEWITGDARPERQEEKWLNVILRKCQ